jgi:hypothetical protein
MSKLANTEVNFNILDYDVSFYKQGNFTLCEIREYAEEGHEMDPVGTGIAKRNCDDHVSDEMGRALSFYRAAFDLVDDEEEDIDEDDF